MSLNTLVILISMFALMFVLIQSYQSKQRSRETFVDTVVASKDNANKMKFLNTLLATNEISKTSPASISINKTSENIDPIASHLQFYISVYGSQSYSGFGNIWRNIAVADNSNVYVTSQGEAVTKDFMFENDPALHTTKGMFMGKNKITGPMSFSLGINGSGEFTMFITARHETLAKNDITNIFKMFGNSTNNNGLSFNVTDVSTTSLIQSGKYSISFAEHTYSSETAFPIDSNLLYMYVLKKTPSKLTVQVLTNINSTPVDIINAQLKNPEVLFSNRKMCLNCNQNWNGYLSAFGAYNVALNQDGTKAIYDYMMNEEKKKDEVYKQYQAELAKLKTQISDLKNCPFDKTTCQTCGGIQDWSNVNDIMLSDTTCRKQIDSYCVKNKTNSYCKCWDPKSDVYNSAQCEHWKNIFKDVQKCEKIDLSQLDKDTVEQIKKKYNLIDSMSPDETNVGKEDLLTLGISSDSAKISIAETNQMLSELQKSTSVVDEKTETVPPEEDVQTVPDHLITQPVKPTSSGFYAWLASWF